MSRSLLPARRSTIPPGPATLLQLAALVAPMTGCSIAPTMTPEADDAPFVLPSIPAPAAVPFGLEMPDEGGDLELVAPNELCVSEGAVVPQGDSADVDSGAMRAVAMGDALPSAAELTFRYRGPSAETEPLADGEVRRQIGLKLRAKDTCNVVYVMWHVDPTPGVHVSVKVNSGSTHAECGAGGYVNLPAPRTQPPALAVGEQHKLRAELDGRTLQVFADDSMIWEGDLPDAALSFDGPAGVRSDNGSFDFELRLPHGTHGKRCST